jgi:phosphatidylglycerol lysyltransferase
VAAFFVLLRLDQVYAVVFVAFGILRLLRPSPAHPRLPTGPELDAAQALVVRGTSNDDWLALTGDKPLLFSAAQDAFIMYGVIGRTWVAMGQPVGPEAAWSELIWRFHEMANRHGARTVFYEVPARALPHFMDLGLSMLKLGEKACVDLAGFGLGGRRRANLRHGHNRAVKEGATFELLSPEQTLACMDRVYHLQHDMRIDRPATVQILGGEARFTPNDAYLMMRTGGL